MRVLISADIEGIATTVQWEQATKTGYGYEAACRQMTAEVRAACEGAHAAGATQIRVKDAHGSGTNLIPELLPRYVELTRSGCGSPWSMVYGVDQGFDAAMFVGYHCAAGRNGNPLSHTETKSTVSVRLNGVPCSEFQLYSWAAAMAGVPSVFLAGDQMLCDDVRGLHPHLVTVPVKQGLGGLITCLHPEEACDRIRAGAEQALRQPDFGPLPVLPEAFVFEATYKEHPVAVRASSFPGCKLVGDNTVRLETRNYWDVLTAVVWIL